MAEKTLGQVAMYAYQKRTSNDIQAWQAVADAVEAAIEARRWQAIESAPEDHYILAWSPERSMAYQVIWCSYCKDWNLIGSDEVPTMEFTHWTPIPAPPKEVERGA